MNTFIQQACNKLNKGDNKDIYNVTNMSISIKSGSLELST